MTPHPRRIALLGPVLVLLLAACGAGTGTATPSPDPSLPLTGASPAPPIGGVDRTFPELSVAESGPGYEIALVDPTASAWRIVVSATGGVSDDRLDLLVEIGDIAPGIEMMMIVGGQVIEATDLAPAIGEETAVTGGCHPTLQVCYSSAGIRLDLDDGVLSLALERIEPGRFTIRGATAEWAGEPFILGPWRTATPVTTW